jgi:hypothetical protein
MFLPCDYYLLGRRTFVQAIQPQTDIGDKKQDVYNLFAAYVHTVPLEELIEGVERARLDAKLRHVVIHGAACSYCLARAERLEGSYLRTFALELKEQLAQTRRICHIDSDSAAWAPRRGRGRGATSSPDH